MYLLCQTYFSMRYGMLSVEELVAQAAAQELPWLGLADINNASAWFDFTRRCQEAGIRPLLGIAFHLQTEEYTRGPQTASTPQWCSTPLYWGIALRNAGLQQLNELLTRRSVEGEPLPRDPADQLPDCALLYPLEHLPPRPLRANEYVAICSAEEAHRLHALSKRCFGPHTVAALRPRAVAAPPVVLRSAEDWEYHRALRAIDRNTVYEAVEEDDCCPRDALLHPPETLQQAFQLLPAALLNAERIAHQCTAALDTQRPKNKRAYTRTPADDLQLLRLLAEKGLQRRYRHAPEATRTAARSRIHKELKVIAEMELCAYYLITWDFVQYAHSCGYWHVGRGSGANSIVAYCIGLTDVDPIELDLYFERFVNRHRATPPDFDIDFSWNERDAIIAYVFRRWGRRHVALQGAYVTFQPRALVRALGKAFGVPEGKLERWMGEGSSLSKPSHRRQYQSIGSLPTEPELLTRRNAAGKQQFRPPNGAPEPVKDRLLRFSQRLLNFPDHLSIHAGGILITEEPLTCYTPLMMMPKGFPVTHWDMYVAEENGFYKYDVLSQRGLGHIRSAVELIEAHRGVKVEITDVERFKQDRRCNELLRRGDTVGCFYIESPAMRQLLRKLDCADYPTLVAASSIIRPGVSASGMMRAYIERHARAHGQNKGTTYDQRGQAPATRDPRDMQYLHPELTRLLADTYGVMVYQEDVIKVCHHFAGMDLAEADLLRRAMSGKYRSSKAFEQVREKFFASCRQNNIEAAVAQELWRQIASFAGYSFSKAHSASFAVESYQSLYLKAHYPVEFYAAVINNFGGFYSTEFYVHAARLHGADVRPPCVQHSATLTTVAGNRLWLGLGLIKSLHQRTIDRIVAARRAHGAFTGLNDFLERVQPGLPQLDVLINAGALRFTGLTRAQLRRQSTHRALHPADTPQLFAPAAQPAAQPDADPAPPTETPLERALHEVRSLGFPTADPFLLLKDADTRHRHCILAPEMRLHIGKKVQMIGYFICRKSVRTQPKDPQQPRRIMAFGHWLDRHGYYFDSTHFPQSYARYPFVGRGFYWMEGTLTDDFGHPSIEVSRMELLPTRRPEDHLPLPRSRSA